MLLVVQTRARGLPNRVSHLGQNPAKMLAYVPPLQINIWYPWQPFQADILKKVEDHSKEDKSQSDDELHKPSIVTTDEDWEGVQTVEAGKFVI